MAARAEQVTLRASGAVARRQAISRGSRWVLLAASLVGVAFLAFLVYDTVEAGGSRLSWDFLTSYPSRFAERAGLRSSILGSTWIMGLTAIMTVPIAVATA